MTTNEIETIVIDVGNEVVCDYCDEDYTNSDKCGGILFGSYAICPACQSEAENNIKKYKEEWNIKKRAAQNQTFRDFVIKDCR